MGRGDGEDALNGGGEPQIVRTNVTTTETKHTETPWWVGSEGVDGGWAGIYAGDEVYIGRVDADEVGDETAAANSAFIVRAVNAHDDLVAACKIALEVIDGLYAQQAMGDDTAMPQVEGIRAALAKAAE